MDSYELVVLAGDIGGTNTNLALVGKKDGAFSILFDRHYKTKEEPSLFEPLRRFLAEAAREKPGLEPSTCCISGAGPVEDGRIALTNAPWGIDGPGIERAFGLPTRVINDFTAVSYGVLNLDPEDPKEITRLASPDGTVAPIGAGPRHHRRRGHRTGRRQRGDRARPLGGFPLRGRAHHPPRLRRGDPGPAALA